MIFVSFTVALRISKNKNIPVYLKQFYLYPLLSLLFSINTIASTYLHLYSFSLQFAMQNIMEIIDFAFWGIFFLHLMKKTDSLKYIRVIFLFFLLIIVAWLFRNNFYKPMFQIFTLGNFGRSIFCIFYFNNLFKDTPKLNLKNEPLFWIITGLFFCSSITLPQYAINDYLHNHINRIISKNIFSSTNIAIIIMHILFIKAYLCTVRQKKLSSYL